jgi:hypothetical protein
VRYRCHYYAEIVHWYRPFFCPCCEGEGSWVEVVDPEIGGPTESCDYCDGEGRIGLGKLIAWVWSVDIVARVRKWWKYGRKG